jgi:hypothetical protein
MAKRMGYEQADKCFKGKKQNTPAAYLLIGRLKYAANYLEDSIR